MRFVLATLVVVACSKSSSAPISGDAAPSATDVASQNGPCTALEARSFTSEAQHECGLGSGGVAYCNWGIAIASHDALASGFAWHHSDVGETGTVECHGASITIHTSQPQALSGDFDATMHILTWDGIRYTL